MRSEVRVCLDGIPRKEKAHTALQRAALLDHLGHYTSIRAQVLRRTHTAWRWIPVGAGMNDQIQAELKGVRMRRPNELRISRRERVVSQSITPPIARDAVGRIAGCAARSILARRVGCACRYPSIA